MNTAGWLVAAFAVLITGISKSGLGGALGGLAVPFLSLWISPRNAAAVMLPILIAMDMVGIRAWSGKADWRDLKVLIPGAIVGIVLGTLAFGVMSDQLVKGLIGLIAVGFTLDRLLRHRGQATTEQRPPRIFGWLSGVGAGFTSTLAHAGGPPVMIYLLSWRQPRETFVATTVFFFSVINLAKLPFYIALGLFSIDTLTMSALLLPLVPVGVWIGMRLLQRIPERPFYLFATAALGLSGVKLLWDGSMA
ncbi:sulfite exporter TauE/SafE family protein [Undibacterium sp. 14-3-2]|uniref:sulfite exporter TauE/SafE family protein n=1 Tax=Undibacterium sp. 14-3-2 TaxID=2800129 RepID=UPI0019088CFC|nr:sulfite exporter TauE/SafE family protein [Undibacterium sp. 14-3-2]MBK1890506.1 sulfite exporter TauE/SafE family protein [Undibacterium sp. 14-3-2]